ncbi:PHP domain protein [Haloterrigena turkmenica DSM 5511]|uniref:PHP domain protein n=1 Tax=Haloterrigena turkmenica (strain ATCC 51198 / DSM 5511 / JCM 9101 / NCIMB 13204 / VKM B-1734 / 4k) TaxID=543526 RepID=D2RX60_HALTV|nr:PHP-associated domain-containing protein [Haloterrigena turkmenica]ADB59672.1 PHP domain protein [Haloterrigena turkmenica DSM 5511]
MYSVDLHAHTRFFHGRRRLGDRFDPLGVRLLARAADRRGLEGVATTNHDYYTPLDPPGGAQTLPGIEITTDRGHVLVVGPDPPEATKPGALSPAEAVALAHDRGCAAIVAHPFRNSTVRELEDVPFDAIEVNGKHPRSRPLVEQLAEERDLPLVGGSDAHYPFEVGRAYTVVEADEFTPESVVDAIRDGRVSARVSESLLDRLLRRGYRAIHNRKRVIDAIERPTPGVGAPPGEEEKAD